MVERRISRAHGFLPNPAKTAFNFSAEVGDRIGSLVVEGRKSSAQSNPLTLSCTQGSVGNRSSFSWTNKSPREQPSVPFWQKTKQLYVKVFQARVTRCRKGKLNFSKISQAFVSADESTANVHYI